jgi:glycosyltransferase involved in cell wall biosynthesis
VTTKTTVVHVAESFASGTASAIADFVRNYPDADHHLVYAFRPEALVDPRTLNSFCSATALPEGTLSRIRFLRRHLLGVRRRTHGEVVVHAHSSKAGGYVRVAVRKSRWLRLVYTPHCYSFERRDVAASVRMGFRVMEWILSFNTTVIGACSPREAVLSRWAPTAPHVVTVPNVQPPGLPQVSAAPAGRQLRIAGSGRLGPQKDPEFFARAFAAASARHPGIEAVWIGGGDDHYVDMLRNAGVTVTGWLPRHEALDVMASCDVYLHTAQWEGFPISIMEAAGMGMPVIARRMPYLTGVDMPVVIDTPTDLTSAVGELLRVDILDRVRRQTMAALAGNSDSFQAEALEQIYGPPVGASR